jgi:hypothetical protein
LRTCGTSPAENEKNVFELRLFGLPFREMLPVDFPEFPVPRSTPQRKSHDRNYGSPKCNAKFALLTMFVGTVCSEFDGSPGTKTQP